MTSMFRPSKNDAQKTKVLFSGVIVAFLMVAYQNCGKMNQAPAVDKSREQKPAVLELDESSSLTLLGNYTHEFGAYAYKVDVATGEVLRTMYEVPAHDPVNKPVKLCLSEDKRVALEVAYNYASVCLFKKSENQQMVCTMEYLSPYAIIKDQAGNTYKLGENAKACYDFYDICTDTRDGFVKAVQDALVGLDSSTCD